MSTISHDSVDTVQPSHHHAHSQRNAAQRGTLPPQQVCNEDSVPQCIIVLPMSYSQSKDLKAVAFFLRNPTGSVPLGFPVNTSKQLTE